MASEWWQILIYVYIGFASGAIFTWLVLADRVERHVTKMVRERETNLKKLQLERNGRTLPKREDSASGVSKIHKVTTRRNQPRRRIDK